MNASAVLAMAVLVIWLALRWLRRELTPARMPHPPLDAQATAQGLRAVSVPTVRGRQLHAWWWPQVQVGKGACAVLMHGWGSNASNLMSAAQHLQAQGWHVLLPDARSHGLSDGDDYSSLPRVAGARHRRRCGAHALRAIALGLATTGPAHAGGGHS